MTKFDTTNQPKDDAYFEKIVTSKKDLVKKTIYAGILSQVYSKGSKIPSCRTIAKQLGVSKNSAYGAYSELIDLGILRSQKRSGFIVDIDIQQLETKIPQNFSSPERKSLPLKRKSLGRNLPDSDERALQPKYWTTYPYPFLYNQIDSHLFPLKEWRVCSRKALKRKSLPIWTSEAVEFDSPDLVYQLCSRLLHHRGINVSKDEILVTVGAQHALTIISTLFIDDTRPIAMEDPGYQEARHLFHLYHNKTVPIPVDENGLIPEQLPNEFKLVYVTPGCHFPTMVIMSQERRQSLIKKAQSSDALIIEDDYEVGLTGHSRIMPALKSLDNDGTVIYVGSLSKTLSPSIRIGYIVAHRDIIKAAKIVRSLTVRHPPSIIQETTSLFLSHGYYDIHLKNLRNEYTRRWHIMRDAIDESLPMLSRGSAQGGTSFWLKGNVGLDSDKLAQLLLKHGVIIEPGHIFFHKGQPRYYFRVAFPSIPKEKIKEGLELIAKEINTL